MTCWKGVLPGADGQEEGWGHVAAIFGSGGGLEGTTHCLPLRESGAPGEPSVALFSVWSSHFTLGSAPPAPSPLGLSETDQESSLCRSAPDGAS